MEFRDGTRKNWQAYSLTRACMKTHTKWLVQNWSTFGARKSHGPDLGSKPPSYSLLYSFGTLLVLGQPRVNWDSLSHHTPGFGVSHHLTRFWWGSQPLPPYSILCSLRRGWHPNGHFVPGLPRLWSLITFGADLRSSCRLKQSCRSHRNLSNGMSHVLYSQVFRVDSRLLLVGSQNWRTPGVRLPGLLLAITCVLDVQMSNASPF